jgi:5,10-methylenetetrahydromethanopterin reductase
LGCVLKEGEPADLPRAVAQAGPRAAVLLHRAADEALAGLPNTTAIPQTVTGEIDGYVALARGFEPADARYLQNHRGHLLLVKPEERPFITEAPIRETTFTGSETELVERIAALRDAGYTQFAIQIVAGPGGGDRGLGTNHGRSERLNRSNQTLPSFCEKVRY